MEGKRKEEDEEEEEEIFYTPERMEEEDEENGAICSSDKEEKRKLCQMRAKVEEQDPACKDIDDMTLRRFLRARDLDVEKASGMFLKYLTWRRAFPKDSIQLSDIPNHLAHNKVFMQGTDKKGCPLLVFFGGRHLATGSDELKRCGVVYLLDKLCSRIPDGQEKFTIIVDLKGYGYSNNDVRGFLAALSIFQDYYPERLQKIFFIHVSYLFMTLWKIVYPFIDKNIRKKVTFVENKRLKASLLEEIKENQLPEIYGGQLPLVPIQDA